MIRLEKLYQITNRVDMINCPKCNSKVIRRGSFYNKTENMMKQRYSCVSCKSAFTLKQLDSPQDTSPFNTRYGNNRYVITSYQGGEYNRDLLKTFENYCEHNNAKLIILHAPNKNDIEEYVDELSNYIVSDNFDIGNYITVYANLTISKTAENPLTGLNSLSRNGKSLIVGHPVLQMKMLSQFGSGHPIMMHTTGSISIPDYKLTSKAGVKADHNHSISGLVIELDYEADIFHLRVLNSRDTGDFYDLDNYYIGDYVYKHQTVDALIFGDTHVSEIDEEVFNATYQNEDSMMNVLLPKIIVHHDIYSHNQLQSHHQRNSFISRYKYHITNRNNIEDELNQTIDFLEQTIPDFVEECVIVSSNHDNHLRVWLDSPDKHHDYVNALLYHKLMVRVLTAIESGEDVNPLKFYIEENCSEYIRSKVRFLGTNESYVLHNIELGLHGHAGISGAKGSPSTFAQMPIRSITGHSHQPNITKSAYVVGTSSRLDLDYVSGLTSWANTHCIVHPNGKRQLVSIIRGKWRLD